MSFKKNIEVVSSETTEGLRAKLLSIDSPYNITFQYHDGKFHVAWIRPDRPFSKMLKNKLKGK